MAVNISLLVQIEIIDIFNFTFELLLIFNFGDFDIKYFSLKNLYATLFLKILASFHKYSHGKVQTNRDCIFVS